MLIMTAWFVGGVVVKRIYFIRARAACANFDLSGQVVFAQDNSYSSRFQRGSSSGMVRTPIPNCYFELTNQLDIPWSYEYIGRDFLGFSHHQIVAMHEVTATDGTTAIVALWITSNNRPDGMFIAKVVFSNVPWSATRLVDAKICRPDRNGLSGDVWPDKVLDKVQRMAWERITITGGTMTRDGRKQLSFGMTVDDVPIAVDVKLRPSDSIKGVWEVFLDPHPTRPDMPEPPANLLADWPFHDDPMILKIANQPSSSGPATSRPAL
jgi:hypothetical protein